MKLFIMMFVVVGAFTSNHAFADTVTNCDKIDQSATGKTVAGKAPAKAAPAPDSTTKQKAD